MNTCTWRALLSLSNETEHCSLTERVFFIDNLLVRIIIMIIRWTGHAPWEFEFTFPGSITFTFLGPLTRLFSCESSDAPTGRMRPGRGDCYRGTSLIRNRDS